MTGVRLFDDMNVSRETQERLDLYVRLLRKWSPRINLVSRSTLADVWQRHVLDSAQLMPLLPERTETVADLGSGAGFPGLVLAIIALEQETPFHVSLVESDQRKATFLREVIRETGASARVVVQRAETLDLMVDVVTARAFAGLNKLLEMAHPLVKGDGIVLLHKGARYKSELTDAAKDWHMEVEQHTSRIDPASVILHISGLTRRQEKS